MALGELEETFRCWLFLREGSEREEGGGAGWWGGEAVKAGQGADQAVAARGGLRSALRGIGNGEEGRGRRTPGPESQSREASGERDGPTCRFVACGSRGDELGGSHQAR